MTTPPSLPDKDLEFQFVRGTGPGGQNVNKVATAAQLRFHLATTQVLTSPVKARLRALAGKRVTAEGDLLIVARNHRTQEGNRRDALERLMDLIAKASIEPIRRKATRPTHGSKLRRLDSKRERKNTKQLRGRIDSD
ncbi:MAG TPA: alternative ribosome rescue aminoacyl-tRNA hydrolase ArfB [Steroidobacteraceae bacterium]|nr:alternative ribosome rescue aminoacyl-tRNA hydrolase ArfB [Steroidobacteraceae bacterium]